MNSILVIDDTEDMQKLIHSNLSARGYEVIPASDGIKGVELAHKKRPDLIILDIMLPDITGWDILGRLKKDSTLQNIPVIIMTASEGLDDEKQALQMGAACFFPKPFSLHAFLGKIEELLSLIKNVPD
jgi:DNA-binding response OmpR family regulator